MKVGYIGLGILGGAIVRRLALSRPVAVFDLNPALVAQQVAAGAVAASGAQDLAASCDVIMLCVPRSENVSQILFGEGGIAEMLKPGQIVIDQTSGDPNVTQALAVRLAERDVVMLDAPVSGGAAGAAQGTLAIMVGGPRDTYDAVTPIFEDISPNHTHCGDIGAGQVLKLLNNTMSTCNRIAMLEALAVGVKNGLTLDVMNRVLNAGGARSAPTERLLPRMVEGGFEATFALALMLKDLNLATSLAVASGAPFQSGQLARGLLQTASNHFGPDANLDDIIELIADQAGTSFGQTWSARSHSQERT